VTLVFFVASLVAGGQTRSDAVRQIAAGFASAIPPHSAVSILFENRSTLDPSAAGEFRRLIQQTLIDGGYTMSDSGSPVRLSLSDNIHGLLAIAQFGAKTVIAPWQAVEISRPAARARIVETPVWSQADPILDLLRSDAAMLVLEPSRVVLYRKAGDGWKLDRFAQLTFNGPVSRDPRGRFIGTMDSFRVSGPGLSCSGSVRADLSLTCNDSSENTWVAGRNFQRDPARGEFYSAAELANGVIVIAGVDRKVHILASAPIVLDGIGSDIAGIRNACGVEWLATKAGSGPDAVTGMNASGSPVTEPLPLNGAVTALWQAEQAEEATAVVYNSSIRQYEAFRLAIRCAE
jgi:hypothetical protein